MEQDTPELRSVTRRRVLKATGAGAVAGAGIVGTAGAHEVEGPVVFCGCSQVCACGDGEADVIYAVPDNGSFTEQRVTESFNFCATVDGFPEGTKIVAIDVDGTIICNPNEACSGDARADLGITCDSYGASPSEPGVPGCGHPPCEHPSQNNGGGNGNVQGRGQGN